MYLRETERKTIMAFVLFTILATAGFIYYAYPPPKDTTYEDTKNFIIRAFQNGEWEVMLDYMLYADEKHIASNPTLLVKHEKGWYSFPGQLKSKMGPWAYNVTLWYNIKTNQTHIQI